MVARPKSGSKDGTARNACRFMRRHARALDRHLGRAAKGKNVRAVHQVRVACRRLRTALAIYGELFPPEDARRWRRRLRKTLDRFGPARDLDVQIRFLKRMLREIPEADTARKPGVRALRRHLKQQREALQPSLERAARRVRRSGLTDELIRAAATAGDADRSPADSLAGQAITIIGRDLARVRERRQSLADAADIRGHHRLRIAVKRLRYTLELFDLSEAFAFEPFVKMLSALQKQLGEMRDCDVWMDLVDAFIAADATPAIQRCRPGLRFLRAHHRRLRTALFRQVKKEISALDRTDFWDRLLAAAQTPGS